MEIKQGNALQPKHFCNIEVQTNGFLFVSKDVRAFRSTAGIN